jgi:hypothetical protein
VTPPTWLFFPATGAPAPPWEPSDLADARCWLDASDSGTITLSGSSITLWEDKIGSNDADDAVDTSNSKITTARPTIATAAQNSLDAVNFASTQRLDHNSSRAMLKDRSHALVGMAFRWGSITDATGQWPNAIFMFIWTHADVGNPSRAMIGGTGTRNWRVLSTREDSTATVDVQTNTAADTNWHIVTASFAWTSGTFELFLDGTSIGSGTYATSGNTGNTDLSTAHDSRTVIGSLTRSHTTQRLPDNSRLGELVVGAKSSGTYTTDDRQKLEGYLAHKWGLEGNLPGGGTPHPYKSAPP